MDRNTIDQPAHGIRRHILEATNDGLTILQFLLDTVDGKIDGMRMTERIAAADLIAGQTLRLSLPQSPPPDSAMEVVLLGNLNLFRRVVRFLVETVEGRHEDVTVCERIVLADTVQGFRNLIDAYSYQSEPSRILSHETGASMKLRNFLRQVVRGDVEGATPADVHSALKLLTS